MNGVEIIVVPAGSGLLADVRTLWRRHSKTLGFFPDGAFDDHAQRGCVLAAVEGDNLLGYLLYRTTGRSQAAIVHLCVAEAARGRGIARRLFAALLPRVARCTDVLLRCRRDFEAHSIWQKLGFAALDDSPGRGQDGGFLTTFRYLISQPPLLALLHEKREGDPARLVIDANVFFDLDEDDPGAEESRALAADWLTPFVELCLTDEIFNEIARADDATHRARQRERARAFTSIAVRGSNEDEIYRSVKGILGDDETPNAVSDARQIMNTIVGGVRFFVTRDTRILKRGDELYEKHAITVLQPHEVVRRFDEIRRTTHYHPRRFFVEAASRWAIAKAGDLDAIAALLPTDELRRKRVAELRDVLADPVGNEVECVRLDDQLLAAFAIDRRAPGVLSIPLFAVSRAPLAEAIARHLARRFISIAADEGRPLVRVRAAGERERAGLEDARYIGNGDAWVRVAVRTVAWRDELACLMEAMPELQRLRELMRAEGLSLGDDGTAELEKAIWPAKLRDARLPCFVVPIKPKWAAQLFDHDLASRSLFGADGPLSLNPENAYYRAASSAAVLAPPGRILWYVSDDPMQPGTMAIRACSYLDDVLVAPAKEAFQAYRHLGIYRWQHVLAAADGDATRKVQAFRFSETELFRRPLPFREVRAALARHGLPNQQFQSPLRIPEACFFELFEAGSRGARAT